ncbi:probable transcription factor At5g28040 [Gastrolobium bilobum]|uniref:probable transcription factor At5g28040 n=1 Tax=Gastrolobium bilobum TaxID=150636 RepID=UPI002AB0F912|nr:probable transcription factor At5g28040 [Gastrolobium bilobum]
MASEPNDAIFPEEDLDDDDETLEEEEEDDDDDDLGEPEDDQQTEPSASALAVPWSAVSNGENASIPMATIVVADSSEPKRQRTEQIEEKKALDDSRRLFQRLWTDEDEIGLLQGFLEYTAQRGSSHHNDTALFYDQIKSKLQLGFNKNQLVEKLRRLKKKYRNVIDKISSGKEFSFKSPHDQATFEISRKIWSNTVPVAGAVEDDDEIKPHSNPNRNFGNSMSWKNEATTEKKTPPRKRSRSRSGMKTEEKKNDGSALNKDNNCICNNNNDDDNYNHNNNNTNNYKSSYSNNIQGLIEEKVRSCLSPVLKELVSSAMGRGFGVLNPIPMPSNLLTLGIGEVVVDDDKWRKQQILELEVYSKRLKLAQDEIKVTLEELRSVDAGR